MKDDMSVIFIFLDGLGLAPAGPDNPLSTVATPALLKLLGGPLTCESIQARDDLLLAPIDATLGAPGLPQSGTGHVALLAGVNAVALHGRHQSSFPPVALRPLLAEQSLFHRVAARGGTATFANAFGAGYWEALATRRLRRSASVIAAQGAALRLCDMDDLRRGQALSWDITGAALQARGEDIPLVEPAEAGARLARLACAHDLVFFESFLLDLAGHQRWSIDMDAAIAATDALIGGALQAKRPDDTLVITSDHGNAESRSAPAHTRNPVPLLVVGPNSALFTSVHDIAGVAGAILMALFGSENG
jgi:hypothetical protein